MLYCPYDPPRPLDFAAGVLFQNVSFTELYGAIRVAAASNIDSGGPQLDTSLLVGRLGTVHKQEVPTLLGDRVAVVHAVTAHPDSIYRSRDGLPLVYLIHRDFARLGDLPPERKDDEAPPAPTSVAEHSAEFHEWIAQAIRSPMPVELKHVMIWAVQQARTTTLPVSAFGKFVGRLSQYTEADGDLTRYRPVYTTADHAAVFHAVAKRCPFTVTCFPYLAAGAQSSMTWGVWGACRDAGSLPTTATATGKRYHEAILQEPGTCCRR